MFWIAGDYGPRYPATPVPTFSSSWDPKPNYFPTQPNHFRSDQIKQII